MNRAVTHADLALPTFPDEHALFGDADPDVTIARMAALGVPEIVRLGMTPEHMPELAGLVARALIGNETAAVVAADVTAFRRRFEGMKFVR